MNLFGLQISRAPRTKKTLSPPGGRWFTIFDFVPGAWQQDASIELESVLTSSTVYACLRLITTDIGKLGIRLVQRDDSGIWSEVRNSPLAVVLRKPNPTQTRIKFFESWLTSKLIYGNAYMLKGRDARGVVTRMNVLDPTRVQVLVSESGEVFYKLRTDNLVSIPVEVMVPAAEIIHDVHFAPENPLVGVSPIAACGLAATQGIKIQGNSRKFFENLSRPSGMLTAPGAISDETAARLKTTFETNFSGDNVGRLFVAGDSLEFKGFSMPAEEAQLIEQLKWTSEDICRAFGVPPYKVGAGTPPPYNNIEALNQQYYSECLQELIECIELLLDEGLELPSTYGTEFDLEGLLRMDSATLTQVLKEQVGAGLLAPDEGRNKLGLHPVPGGKFPYLQQQNYSLEALAKRDAQDDPFGTSKPAPAPAPAPTAPEEDDDEELAASMRMFKALAMMPGLEVLTAEVIERPPMTFNLTVGAPTTNLALAPHLHASLPAPRIEIGGPVVNMKSEPVTVHAPVRVEPAQVTLLPPVVNVDPHINIDAKSPDVHVHNRMVPEVHVAPAQVKIDNRQEPPIVNVRNEMLAPVVTVTNEVPSPSITVHSPYVHVDPPVVNVTNEVQTPTITVRSPDVNVAAPIIRNELPEYEIVEQEHKRGKDGLLSKTITTKRRTKRKRK